MPEEKRPEPGHEFLARLGKTRLRPGGREATEWLLSHVDFTADTRVLEVACNMGTTMVALAELHGCRITGLDMNPKALEKARANIEKHGLRDVIDVVEGNALALPFPEASFDVVDRALQVLAGVGITGDHRIQRFYRDLRVDRVSGGTDEMMILTTGRSALYPYR